jgi:signal transduction histidine kinase
MMSLTPEQTEELKAFLRTLSHELRDPLTSIQGYAEAILLSTEDQQDQEIQEFAQSIIANSRKMLALIDKIKIYRQILEEQNQANSHSSQSNDSLLGSE